MLATHVPIVMRRVATPRSWAVAMASLLTSVVKTASNPASSASRAPICMSRALQPAPGMTPSASGSVISPSVPPRPNAAPWSPATACPHAPAEPRRFLLPYFAPSHVHGGTVQPCKSYSLMHWSAKDVKPSRCPPARAKFSTSSRICSWLPA